MKKIIESNFPIDSISEIANRESNKKEVYNPLSYIHKWWAKRLGTVFRSIIIGSILNENHSLTDKLFSQNDFENITIYDPFMGSGTTVVEAIKLGCKTIGRDINPVSFTMVNAAIQDYTFSEVEEVYKDIENSVKGNIEQWYTSISKDNDKLLVLYYFWVNTVKCKYCNHEIDLFKSRIFSKNAVPKKDSTARSVCPKCNAINHIQYNDKSVKCSECENVYNPQQGNINKGKVTCDCCGKTFNLIDIVRNSDDILNSRMYAKMVINSKGEKEYLNINNYDIELYSKAKCELKKYEMLIPNEEIKEGYNTNQVINYNYKYWKQMFNDRQLLCHCMLLEKIRKIDNLKLRQLFTCLFTGMLEFNNTFVSFKGEGTGAVRHMFSNHILKPEVMPLEGNVWGTPKSSGSFSTLYKSRIVKAMEYKENPYQLSLTLKDSKFISNKVGNINKKINMEVVNRYDDFGDDKVYLSCGDSSDTDIDKESIDIVVTDPPFFDNVHYSELADFFYCWMKKLLPEQKYMNYYSTRFNEEVQDVDSEGFSNKLENVLKECNRVLKKNGLLVFTYHHSKIEGWTSLYKAIDYAGFYVSSTQPIKAEFANSMAIKKSKISINLDLILVCRKKDDTSKTKKKEIDFDIIKKEVKEQISKFENTSINLSVGDKFIIAMGSLISKLDLLENIDEKIELLHKYESNIDEFIKEINIK